MRHSFIPTIRQIDELGRIVIPKELRKALLIGDFQPMEVRASGNEIILKRYDVPETINFQLEEIADRVMEYNSVIGAKNTAQIVQQLAETRSILKVAEANKSL